METCIVLISVDYCNARKVCNFIENTKHNNREEVKELINQKRGEVVKGGISIYRLTDFMEEVNDQYLDNLTEYFISYVHVNLEI